MNKAPPSAHASVLVSFPMIHKKIKRLQDVGSKFPRRTSKTNLRAKGSSTPSVAIVIDRSTSIVNDLYGYEVSPSNSVSEGNSHSVGKRGRYQRRGSKTSYMIRCEGCLKAEEDDTATSLKSSLAQYVKSLRRSTSSLDDDSTQSMNDNMEQDHAISSTSSLPPSTTRCNFEPLSPLLERMTLSKIKPSNSFVRGTSSSPRDGKRETIALVSTALELAIIED